MANTNLVDELESSFQNCMALMTNQEHFCITTDADEMRNSMEQAMQKFLDASRRLDCFFMQKRLLLSVQKPESSAKEDLVDLKAELERKNALLQRHYERLQNWMTMINRSPPPNSLSGIGTSSPPGPTTGQPVGSQAAGTPSQNQPGAIAGSSMQPTSSQPSTPVIGSQSGFSNQGPLAFLEQTTSSIGLSSRGGGVGGSGGN